MISLSTDIKYIKGVGEKSAAMFSRLGVFSVRDLLYNFPKSYEDWSASVPISEAPLNLDAHIKAKIISKPLKTISKNGKIIYNAIASDGSGFLNLVFFGNKYIPAQLLEDSEYLFYGKITKNYKGELSMVSPAFMTASGNERIHAVYRLTNKLSNKKIESVVKTAFFELGNIRETLPPYLIEKYRLPALRDALYNMHFPECEKSLIKAKRRLIFEELLVMELGLLSVKNVSQKENSFKIKNDFTGEFFKFLPFTPTNAQKRCVSECIRDMKSAHTMNRLLEGDVGSGKTAVAAAVIYSAVKNGFQCALMTPTEILSEQHYNSFKEILGDKINISLLTGSVKKTEKSAVKSGVKSGETDLLIGTRALIEKDVEFKNLGLVITDEQHRFGVSQRAALKEKGKNPHVLVMSATPIPRTLGLIIYGDLDISVLDEIPKGRKSVKTYLVTSEYKKRLYSFIKKKISDGRQCYIVCPLIEENEESSLKSAKEYKEYLQNEIFASFKVGLLHGKMKSNEKENIMKSFSLGEIDILVSTTVIEVGIDVPNAALMVIENAERFGLSQLHQLRGRIGRGHYDSFCVLVSDNKSEETKKRLNIMLNTSDGFKIAEEDLKLRGPGEFLGSRQHGLPELKLANLATDTKALFASRDIAVDILNGDPDLSKPCHSELKNEIVLSFNI